MPQQRSRVCADTPLRNLLRIKFLLPTKRKKPARALPWQLLGNTGVLRFISLRIVSHSSEPLFFKKRGKVGALQPHTYPTLQL